MFHEPILISKVKTISWNINGWNAKTPDLLTIIAETDPDVILLQEIKIAVDATGRTPQGYKATVAPRTSHGGGLATLVKDSPDFQVIKKTISPAFELIQIQLKNDLVISNIYIPPQTQDSPVPEVMKKLSEIMDRQFNHLMSGDFNAHSDLWFRAASENTRGAKVAELVEQTPHLIIMNEDTFTRADTHSISSPDITITTSDIASLCNWSTLRKLASDHLPILIHTNSACPAVPRPKKCIANFRKADWLTYRKSIEAKLDDFNGPNDVISMERYLSIAILEADRIAVPKGTIKPEDHRESGEIRALQAELSQLHHRNPMDPTIQTLSREIQLKRIISKREQWREKVDTMEAKRKTDCNVAWRMIRGMKRPTQSACPVDFGNGIPITGKVAADRMARHLVNAGKGSMSTSEENEWRRMKRTQYMEAKVSGWSADITTAELALLSSKMRNSKALGPEGFSQCHIKNLPNCAFHFLAAMYNQSLNTNVIPANWKKAVVIFIPKPKKDPSKASSYRPISLLSPIAKLLERCILKRISDQITSPAYQHGFKAEHSTSTALTEVINSIVGGLNMKQPAKRTVMTCLDRPLIRRAAFDQGATSKSTGGDQNPLEQTQRYEGRSAKGQSHKIRSRILELGPTQQDPGSHAATIE